ncbi:hypothetical protein [Sphingomicrobium sediminis]|uniref:Uncharacterized protein n=1 Tax=Sphingomicrobium sediminis TaxID=2950949 RepID=A0A9X2J2M7_9SPHN|nr:hypothetical protein [Sphingomicrobium sediminis]MCM8558458.1 hypothetical protein [Sphingomicrobium sediminis]
MIHFVFKAATILFAIAYFVGMGIFAMARMNWINQDWMEIAFAILKPLGMPWNDWFTMQLDEFGSPFINLILLWLMTSLLKKRRRGR